MRTPLFVPVLQAAPTGADAARPSRSRTVSLSATRVTRGPAR